MWRYFLLALVVGCSKPKVELPPPVEVKAYTIVAQTIPADFEFVGVAESSHPVEIRSRVEGYLLKIDYVEGSLVKQGDLLFEIDPRQFVAAVDEAKGEVARQKAILWSAEQAVGRYKPLYEEKAASKKDLDDATANEMAGIASVEAATAKLTEAELNLSYTTIVSPIDGLTARAKYREGTLITPSINGLLTLVSVIDPIWVIFSVADNYLLQSQEAIAKNRIDYPDEKDFTVTLVLSDGSTFPHTGKVNFASPTLDPNTGTMTVRAVFPNPDSTILPGQFVRAVVKGATRPNAIIVPQTAVQQGAKGMYVYTIDEDHIARLRLVEVGTWYQNYWIINSGLNEGEVIVATGVNKVHDGMPVKIQS